MKLHIPRLLIPILILLVIDLYVFQAVRAVSPQNAKRWIYVVYWSFTILTLGLFLGSVFSSWQEWPRFIKTYVVAIVMVGAVCKLLVVPFLAIDDIIRGGKWVYTKLSGPGGTVDGEGLRISRSQFIVGAGLLLSAIPFTSLTWGIIRGPYHFRILRKKLTFPNLPAAFEGLRIVQISDIHIGSWSGPEPLQRAVNMINEQKADIILFTGDLVNNEAKEAIPFKPLLKQITAPHGVYSSLGNHDYGEYASWPDEESKQKNFNDLVDTHKELGWKLLRNQNVIINRDNEKIAIAGCENWSASRRFPKFGDLNKTLRGLEDVPFTILMTHDPSHWDAEVLKHPQNVDLTLSGHTHGMQFGVDFSWMRWSPAQWFYKQWADLYNANKQYIYVNRGLGFIGYPGRVGVKPEITVFELHRKT